MDFSSVTSVLLLAEYSAQQAYVLNLLVYDSLVKFCIYALDGQVHRND